MDLQNLKNNYALLLSHMESKNYKRQYIRFIEKEIHWILKESEYYKWKTYDDIYQTYVDKWKNRYTLANRRRVLAQIQTFGFEPTHGRRTFLYCIADPLGLQDRAG